MTNPRLSRSLPDTPPAPPVRIVHLGLGNFHRAHQAWYTARAGDAVAVGHRRLHRPPRRRGRRRWRPRTVSTRLITRQVDGDEFEVIGSVAAVHPSTEHQTYLDYLARPEVTMITITVTEAGYLRGAGRAPRRRFRTIRRRGPDRGRDRAGGLAARQAGRRSARPPEQRSRADHDPVVRQLAGERRRHLRSRPGPGPSSSIRTCSVGSRTTSTSPPPWWTGSLPSPPTPTETP